MRLVIITGMSGAGKSTALKFLEDAGYFCADNLPPSLIPELAKICLKPGTGIENVALGIDIRGGWLFNDLFSVLDGIDRADYDCKILYLDASDEVLQKRYKETRRSHPLAKNDRVITGIEKERELLREVKLRADYILDTSQTLARHLREKIIGIFLDNEQFGNLVVTVLSFGFKHGIPPDSDLVLDVRFIPNPFYLPDLKDLSGNDVPVREYVMGWDESKVFLLKLEDMLEFLLPSYVKEGKNQLVIAIGCTGGRHRSVTLANELYDRLKARGYYVNLSHKDIDK